MAIYTQAEQPEHAYAYHALSTAFVLGFKFLAWLNALGVLLIVICALGIIQTDVTPYLFRLPLAAFLCGLAFCGLGLLWGYFAQINLFSQLITGRARRTHWIPMICLVAAYGFSMLAFVIACWFTVSLAGLVYQGPSPHDSSVRSFDQSGEAFKFMHDAVKHPIVYTSAPYVNP